MTRTLRRRDLKEPVRDGKCWRGCDGMFCSVCSSNRQNKKLKESIRAKEIING